MARTVIMFMKKLPNGRPTLFVEKIIKCMHERNPHLLIHTEDVKPKLHTIRRGYHRRPGIRLDMRTWSGIPYRSKQEPFLSMDVISVQNFDVRIRHGKQYMFIDRKRFYDIERLAENDGLTAEEFREYFNENFEGQIIHWTELRY